jgi:hypothetical protein
MDPQNFKKLLKEKELEKEEKQKLIQQIEYKIGTIITDEIRKTGVIRID